MDHEYSVLGGLNRATIGRGLTMAASAIAAGIGAAVAFFSDWARSHGYVEQNLILWPLSAGVIYGVLYWFFEKIAWRFEVLSGLLKVPNLGGKWSCDGESTDPKDGQVRHWKGEITIVQSWDKLRIRLNTSQSGSSSTTAALVYEPSEGFRLLYNYKNDPRIGEDDLRSHRGAADFLFSPDLKSAKGEYFTGYGRGNFGKMTLTRIDGQ